MRFLYQPTPCCHCGARTRITFWTRRGFLKPSQAQLHRLFMSDKPSNNTREMHEGKDALDRFRKAMKTIAAVPKTSMPKASNTKVTAKRRQWSAK